MAWRGALTCRAIHTVPREDRIVGRSLLYGYRGPDVLDRHRVLCGPNRHQGVGRHVPDMRALVVIGSQVPMGVNVSRLVGRLAVHR